MMNQTSKSKFFVVAKAVNWSGAQWQVKAGFATKTEAVAYAATLDVTPSHNQPIEVQAFAVSRNFIRREFNITAADADKRLHEMELGIY